MVNTAERVLRGEELEQAALGVCAERLGSDYGSANGVFFERLWSSIFLHGRPLRGFWVWNELLDGFEKDAGVLDSLSRKREERGGPRSRARI